MAHHQFVKAEQQTFNASGSGGNGGPYAYSWNDSSPFGASPVVAPINDSIFTVTISDGCSPEVNQSIPLTVYPLPESRFHSSCNFQDAHR
ncbi:MAG: hypothetical protein IPN88_19260 [Bacteroidetes bacterium]|nr:hypothetical protein [Bacteroidota bacterium]